MILLLGCRKDETSQSFFNLLKEDCPVPVVSIQFKDIVKNGSLTLTTDNENDITSYLYDGLNKLEVLSDDIKVCYLPESIYVGKEWLSLNNKLDIDYAQQEWWAVLMAYFQGQRKIKFINPKSGWLDLFSEVEHYLLFQKFGIQVPDASITNNFKDAIHFYNLWNQQVIFKSIRNGYDTSKRMELEDLTRIDTLKYSPAIFQKALSGEEIITCLVGYEILALKKTYPGNQVEYEKIDLPDELKVKLRDISAYLGIPIILFNFMYSPVYDEYIGFSINIYPYHSVLYTTFGEDFHKSLKNLLIKEALA